ncbi:MAG: serine hydrolase [Spirochaetes bacterium]|nr:serine hydrolase [Spirochaetota bacterium]
MNDTMLPPEAGRELDRRLTAVLDKPGAELSGLAVVAVRGEDVVYEGYFGHRTFDAAGRRGLLPVDRETRFRVASLSKTVTGIGVMRLVERGLLDPDADLSDCLGFPLRNPHYPDAAITARMLLSHTSSLRDEGFYFPPLPQRIEELLLPGGRYYEDGLHFAGPAAGKDNAPGRRYCYCNLGFGLIGTCIERLSGQRFDLYMRDEVLSPLGIDGSFNVNLLSDAGFGNIAPLYRKARGEDGPWDREGPWLAQVDDYRGIRPTLPMRVDDAGNHPPPRLEDYVIGMNGSLFSPQGGLRISAFDLSKILRAFMNGGRLGSVRLLESRTVATMMTSQWKHDPGKDNGEVCGMTRETGLALMHTTDTEDGYGSDRLVAEGGVKLWGHHGDAYGLLGGLLFEPAGKFGFVYLVGGESVPPAGNRGRFSSFFIWEEEIHAAMIDMLRPR